MATTPSADEVRIDKVVVVAIRTTYRNGRPIKETPSAQVSLFREAVPDVWSFLDESLNGPRKDPDPRS